MMISRKRKCISPMPAALLAKRKSMTHGLNLAVSAGVLLFEAKRQKDLASDDQRGG